MRSSHHYAHLDRYESGHATTHLSPTIVTSGHDREAIAHTKQEPTLAAQLRFVKAQSHYQFSGPRVTEKWMTTEAHEAFRVAADYVSQLVVGERPISYDTFIPDMPPTFYQAMGIGVRTYLHADFAATGAE